MKLASLHKHVYSFINRPILLIKNATLQKIAFALLAEIRDGSSGMDKAGLPIDTNHSLQLIAAIAIDNFTKSVYSFVNLGST